MARTSASLRPGPEHAAQMAPVHRARLAARRATAPSATTDGGRGGHDLGQLLHGRPERPVDEVRRPGTDIGVAVGVGVGVGAGARRSR